MAPAIYEPLNEDMLDVRFLRLSPAPRLDDPIHCFVYKASVMDDTYPAFKALSYCWGNPTPARQIILNSSIVNVGPNLDCALRHLRDKSTDVELWVDALCINQNDLDERSSQVQLMDSMYSDADEVVVWLGDASYDSNAAIDLIKQWSEWFELKGKVEKPAAFSITEDFHLAFDMSAIEAISRLLSRPYWERVWVVQEVACAKEVVVMCGSERLAFDHFENASDAWTTVCDSLSAKSEFLSQYMLLDSLRHRNLQQMIRHRNFRILSYLDWDQPREPFLDVLESSRHLKCSDPRDKIYGFLSLGGPHTKHFTIIASPDYKKSPEDVYCEVAERLLLDDRSLRPIVIASGINSCPTNVSKLALPSWVPDWTCKDSLGSMYLSFEKIGNDARNKVDIGSFVRFSKDHRVMTSKGVIYDTITKVFPAQWLDDLRANKAFILESFLGERCSNGIPKLQALFRVITMNMAWPDADDAESRRSFLDKAGWYLWKFWPRDEEDSENNTTSVLLASDFFHGAPVVLLQEFTKMIQSGIRWKEEDVQRNITDFWTAARQRTLHRVLFETEQGRMGLGPSGARMDDKICILHGYPGPLCLEPDDTWFTLKGECCLEDISIIDLAKVLASGYAREIEIH